MQHVVFVGSEASKPKHVDTADAGGKNQSILSQLVRSDGRWRRAVASGKGKWVRKKDRETVVRE